MAPRLQAAERKQLIIEAARALFAEKGFSGTSVRAIARDAGVSEALLYKHFPDKQHIYQEILSYTGDLSGIFSKRLEALKPGSDTLVKYVFLLVRLILFEVPGMEKPQYWHERLMFRSLIGDTTFARVHLENVMHYSSDIFDRCVAEATAVGDMTPSPIKTANSFWFAHHLAMSLNLCHLSGEPAFNYPGSKRELMHQAVRFILRGMGMKDDVIDQHFQPEKLEAFFHQVYG
jgi:AcrR family transcriptional regulator